MAVRVKASSGLQSLAFFGSVPVQVQLASAGIIQLGWTTLGAHYTSEEGIGDGNDRWGRFVWTVLTRVGGARCGLGTSAFFC